MLRVDGGLRNGRDVLVLAAMGGDEFGFGTVAMIATGCIMARVCHTNNCPVGVASQREELRARFPGTPGDLVSLTAAHDLNQLGPASLCPAVLYVTALSNHGGRNALLEESICMYSLHLLY